MSATDAARVRMVERQLRRRGIVDERVIAAMATIPREAFVRSDQCPQAYDDGPLPIGCEQTISQPYVVAAMCALLRLAGDERVLEVGTGSGYAAAVLDELAAGVITIERHAELARRAAAALAATGHERVEVRVGDGSLGAPVEAPFEAIVVAAAAAQPPTALLDQLAPGGRLVLPVGGRHDQRLTLIERGRSGLVRHEFMRCRFVPLVVAADGE